MTEPTDKNADATDQNDATEVLERPGPPGVVNSISDDTLERPGPPGVTNIDAEDDEDDVLERPGPPGVVN